MFFIFMLYLFAPKKIIAIKLLLFFSGTRCFVNCLRPGFEILIPKFSKKFVRIPNVQVATSAQLKKYLMMA